MRALPRWSLLLLLAGPARAEGVAVGPLSYALKIDVGREHSCSQSEESFGELGHFALEIDAKGAASLFLDLFHFHSSGANRELDHAGPPPERDDSRQRTRWTGAATQQGEQLIVKFSAVASSSELWGAEFHPGPPAPSALVLTCKPGHVTLDGDKPGSVSVLLCRPSELLLDFQDSQVKALAAGLYVDGQLPLAPKPGLTSRIEERGADRHAHLSRAD